MPSRPTPTWRSPTTVAPRGATAPSRASTCRSDSPRDSRRDRRVALLGDVVRAGRACERLAVQRALRRIARAGQPRRVESLVELVGVDLERDARGGGLGGAA